MRTAPFLLTAGLALLPAGARSADPPQGWEFTGRTQAVAAVEVRARASGYLTRVAVKEGAAVAKGDLLAEIDPRPYRLDLDAAEARLKAAEARLQGARLKTANARALTQKKVTSPDELAGYEAAEAEAAAGVAAAKAEAGRAQLTLSWARITAPLAGRVSRIRTTEGNLAAADRTVILTVVATDPLSVYFDVPEATLLQLRRDGLADPGKLAAAVGFALDEGYPRPAKLDLIGLEVDPATGTARCRATIPNPDGLFSPGMSARVRLTPPK